MSSIDRERGIFMNREAMRFSAAPDFLEKIKRIARYISLYKEYDARIDVKKRVTLRGAQYSN